MSATGPLADRKAHLSRKLAAIARLAAHLNYSRHRLPYPLKSLAALDDAALESVSALLERFGKLQDMLGGAFREIISLSGEDATDMNDVLSRLEKVGVLPSADDWRALRALRNLGAHEYDDNDGAKTRFVNEVAERAADLIELAEKTDAYAREKLALD